MYKIQGWPKSYGIPQDIWGKRKEVLTYKRFTLKMEAIIWDNFLWYPVSANDIILYEPSHMLGFWYRVGGRLHPLGEVVNFH